MTTALIIVDVQNDFCPGGALAVSQGDDVVDVINVMQTRVDLVVATQDWHPPGHESFASVHPGRTPGELITLHGLPQVLWPDHCVQGTAGAAFHERLDMQRVARVFTKGTHVDVDSYSGFFDNGKRHDTGLHAYLSSVGVDRVWVAGLATDYCVKFTALDAAGCGFDTEVWLSASRAVELQPGDEGRAVEALRNAGVVVHDREVMP